jgi:hypothetical protein
MVYFCAPQVSTLLRLSKKIYRKMSHEDINAKKNVIEYYLFDSNHSKRRYYHLQQKIFNENRVILWFIALCMDHMNRMTSYLYIYRMFIRFFYFEKFLLYRTIIKNSQPFHFSILWYTTFMLFSNVHSIRRKHNIQ